MGRAGHILDPRNATLFQAIDGLGLTTNLELCLDAGDLRSYGTGMTWLDTSGNGYDFYRGNSANDTGSDLPTFNGDVGRRTNGEYWSFDGGDYFVYDSANETWMENIHKDSATNTFVGWSYVTGFSANSGIAATCSSSATQIGFSFYNQITTGRLTYRISDGSGSLAMLADSTLGPTVNQWHFFAVSSDEPNGNVVFQINGTQETQTGKTMDTPSASDATLTFAIAARGSGGNSPPPNGSRMAMFGGWSSALTAAQLDAVYQATRGRFGV